MFPNIIVSENVDPEQMVLFGFRVQITDQLPMYPSPGEDAKRIVRHGFADAKPDWLNGSSIMDWLGMPVGFEPGEPTRFMFDETNRIVYTSPVGLKILIARAKKMGGKVN